MSGIIVCVSRSFLSARDGDLLVTAGMFHKISAVCVCERLME